MNRLAAIIAALALVAGGATYVLMRPASEPPKAVASAPAEPAAPLPRVLGKPRPAEVPAAKPAAPRGAAASAPVGTAPDAPAATASTAPLGVMHFVSDVPGAKVFIDRVPVGVTPVTVPNIKPGSHRLNLSLEGYDAIVETIEVAPGPSDYVIKYKEVRLDAKIDVVHKHRMGSCKGTLVATQRGLRYDTADKNDAFAVALADIETLQIDYLENRLRVSLRGGKRFDFSDPEGNADHLFVFHRDVEKARERLKRGDQPAPE